MIALVKAVISLDTGKIISQEIIKEIDMTQEEYYAPIVDILGKRMMEQFRNGELVEKSASGVAID